MTTILSKKVSNVPDNHLRKKMAQKTLLNNPDITKFINTTASKGSNTPLHILDTFQTLNSGHPFHDTSTLG